MGLVAGTHYKSPMVKFLSWTIYFYYFESYLFDRELFYEKAFFLSGLFLSSTTLGSGLWVVLLSFVGVLGAVFVCVGALIPSLTWPSKPVSYALFHLTESHPISKHPPFRIT